MSGKRLVSLAFMVLAVIAGLYVYEKWVKKS
jgi:hypothetical protein